MLNNLKAEIVRKGLDPVQTIVKVLGCSEKTARNKLNGVTSITVPEAVEVLTQVFGLGAFSIEYLFASDPVNKSA